jgi:nuclear pore complex protein Nup85
MVDEGNYSSAASLLHSLLWSKLAPKYFWVTLLMDAIPFLTADELLFTSEQTYELLQCLQVSEPNLGPGKDLNSIWGISH